MVTNVLVKFNTGLKEYSYLSDIDLVVGDKVVVDTQQNGLVVVTVCKVRGLSQNQLSRASKYVVQKVDMAAYNERMKKQEIAQEIRNKLQMYKRRVEETFIYEKLAENSPEIKALLDELKGLGAEYMFPTSTRSVIDAQFEEVIGCDNN